MQYIIIAQIIARLLSVLIVPLKAKALKTPSPIDDLLISLVEDVTKLVNNEEVTATFKSLK